MNEELYFISLSVKKMFKSTTNNVVFTIILGFSCFTFTFILAQINPVFLLMLLLIFCFIYIFIKISVDKILLIWVLLSPILSQVQENYEILYFGGGIPDLHFNRLFLFIILGKLSAIIYFRKKNPNFFFNTLTDKWILFVLILIFVFSYRSCLPLNNTIQTIENRTMPILLFWISRFCLLSYNNEFEKRFLTLLLLLGFFQLVFEVINQFFDIEKVLFPTDIYQETFRSRQIGFMRNPAIYGSFLTLCFLITVIPNLLVKINIERILLMFSFVWGILLSLTRSAWLSFSAVLLFPVSMIRKRLIFITFSMFLILFFLTLNVKKLVLVPTNNFSSRFFEEENVIYRIAAINKGIELFPSNPLLGGGMGYYDNVLLKGSYDFKYNYSQTGNSSHNTFLTILVDHGLIVTIPYICLLITLLLRSLKFFTVERKKNDSFIFLVWGNSIIYFITAMLIDIVHFPYYNSIFWIIWGIFEGKIVAHRFFLRNNITQ